VGHGYTRVGEVGVVVNDGGTVNSSLSGHGPETLIPMNVARRC
jgi:hypothetical protein